MAPTRTCVGCRNARPAGEMIRIVRQGDGQLAVAHSSQGRGAWLCQGSLPCFEAAAKRRAFNRAFRTPVEAEALDRLRAGLGRRWEQPTHDVRE